MGRNVYQDWYAAGPVFFFLNAFVHLCPHFDCIQYYIKIDLKALGKRYDSRLIGDWSGLMYEFISLFHDIQNEMEIDLDTFGKRYWSRLIGGWFWDGISPTSRQVGLKEVSIITFNMWHANHHK